MARPFETVPDPPRAQILFPLVHTLCPASASMTPVTSNAPASVDVDTFVTFSWVIVVDPADRVVPTDVDPVMEADPAIERLLEPVMNPEGTHSRRRGPSK